MERWEAPGLLARVWHAAYRGSGGSGTFLSISALMNSTANRCDSGDTSTGSPAYQRKVPRFRDGVHTAMLGIARLHNLAFSG
jgi:hypothetical protein